MTGAGGESSDQVTSGATVGHSRGEKLALCAVLAVATIVRLPPAVSHSLWLDEGVTYSLVSRSWPAMTRLFVEEPNGLLYALMLRPLLELGDDEWLLRLPAMVAGLAAVVALWWAARELDLHRAALGAAALLAVSPLAVRVSADARPYSGIVLASCLAVATLARAVRRGGARWWIAYAACLVAMVHLNALAVLVVPAHALVVVRRRPPPWSAWFGTVGGAALASIPMAVLVVHDRLQRDPLYWVTSDSVVDLARHTARYLGYHPVLAAAELTLIGIAVVASRPWPPRRSVSCHLRGPITPVAAWAVLPPVLIYTLSQVTPMLEDRYFIAALPGVCLLVAASLLPWRRRVATGLLTALLAASVIVVIDRNWPLERMGEDWRAAMHRLDALRAPGDPVIFDGADAISVAGYYSGSFRVGDGRVVVPHWDHELPAGVLAFQPAGSYTEVPEGPIDSATIAGQIQRTGRVFVVVTDHDHVGAPAFDGPGSQWARENCVVEYRTFARVVLVVITGCRTAPG